ncbi:MAG: hypothetical protein LBT89_00780, partial [Planctomycetaceae bacterium]|nr:hypothetical protein [Planctomycetaceae bacterium]
TNIIAIDWSPLQRRQKSSGDWIDWDWAAHLIKEQSGIDTEKYLNLMGKETLKRWMSAMVDTLNLPAATAAQIPKAVEQVDGNLFGSEGLRLEAEKTHIIGFSHGAHIAGMLGSRQNGKVRRITALDPSTRIVHLQPENYWGNAWDKNSACFVDMYASSSVLGTSKIYGHRTFFVKPKKANSWWYPDVFHPVESHLYSAKWFLSTIGGSDNRFGYAISVTQKDTEDKMTNITSTLPRAGEFDGIDEAVENE